MCLLAPGFIAIALYSHQGPYFRQIKLDFTLCYMRIFGMSFDASGKCIAKNLDVTNGILVERGRLSINLGGFQFDP